jgi:hypothetical protein
MFALIEYYWISARGYRLCPWKSPYLQWRFETFLGKEAFPLDARKFLQLSWKYRVELRRFAAWAAERRRIQKERESAIGSGE